jgi:nickel-dependent lactate racemase
MLSGTPQEIRETIMAIPDKETIPEQWCAQIFSEILLKHKVILVTTNLDHDLVRKVNLIPASSIDEALAMAFEEKGPDAEIVAIPDGVSVIAVK